MPDDNPRTSILLARLIGPLLCAIGLGMLANGEVYRLMAADFLQSLGLIYLSGLLSLVAGLAIVNAHNVWAADWRVVITVLGWLGIIGGVCRIVVPQFVVLVGVPIISHGTVLLVAGIVVILIGALLSYKAYWR